MLGFGTTCHFFHGKPRYRCCGNEFPHTTNNKVNGWIVLLFSTTFLELRHIFERRYRAGWAGENMPRRKGFEPRQIRIREISYAFMTCLPLFLPTHCSAQMFIHLTSSWFPIFIQSSFRWSFLDLPGTSLAKYPGFWKGLRGRRCKKH